jgi:hypothetical protein
VEGFFDEPSQLRFHLDIVSQDGLLKINADGKTIFEKQFKLGPGEGEWKKAEYKDEWKIYQNLYDKDYTAEVPAKTRRIEVVMAEGDWITFSALEITPKNGGKPILIKPTNRDWGIKPNALYLTKDGVPDSVKNTGGVDRAWLKKNNVDAWKAFAEKGVGVMVGEWGSYNKTPHDVALRWMKDCLENWKEAGFGWALWNFRGDFGILDSNRPDVQYEDWKGHKLDRRMLELLQAY